MSLKQIKENFYKKHPNAIAYIVYNEKLNKYICYSYNVVENTTGIINKEEVKKIMQKSNLDCASAIVSVIEKTNLDLYAHFSDFYSEIYYYDPEKYNTPDAFCDGFNKYLAKVTNKNTTNTSNPVVFAYVINENGDIEDSIFNMDLTIKTNSYGIKTCIIENTFTEDDYKCAGIHGMGIKFLEAVLSEKHVSTIIGTSQECDVYQSSNNSTLVEHYKKLGFEVDQESDGTYKLFKCVNSEPSIDISKPDKTPQK